MFARNLKFDGAPTALPKGDKKKENCVEATGYEDKRIEGKGFEGQDFEVQIPAVHEI